MAYYDFFSLVKNVIYIVLFLAVFCIVYLYVNQNKMIYIPEGNHTIINYFIILISSECMH